MVDAGRDSGRDQGSAWGEVSGTMAGLRLHPAARAEHDAAVDWYERERPGLGWAFALAVSATTAAIQSNPLAFAPWPARPRYRRAIVGGFPFSVFFEVNGDRILVLAIAHAKRRPGYWAKR